MARRTLDLKTELAVKSFIKTLRDTNDPDSEVLAAMRTKHEANKDFMKLTDLALSLKRNIIRRQTSGA